MIFTEKWIVLRSSWEVNQIHIAHVSCNWLQTSHYQVHVVSGYVSCTVEMMIVNCGNCSSLISFISSFVKEREFGRSLYFIILRFISRALFSAAIDQDYTGVLIYFRSASWAAANRAAAKFCTCIFICFLKYCDAMEKNLLPYFICSENECCRFTLELVEEYCARYVYWCPLTWTILFVTTNKKHRKTLDSTQDINILKH